MATIVETQGGDNKPPADEELPQVTDLDEAPADEDEAVPPLYPEIERHAARIKTGQSVKSTKSGDTTATARAAPPQPVIFVLAVAFYAMIWLLTWPKEWKPTSADPFGLEAPSIPHPAGPGGLYFALLLILVLGNALGFAVERLTGLPGLLGMLVAGMVLKNALPVECLSGMSTSMNSTLRNMALGIIMIRAGLGLDLQVLKEKCSTMAFLSFVPCLGEACTVMFISVACFGLVQWEWIWGLQLGFIIADVSPAVTTPLLLWFNDKGYGKAKGIPTILMAAGSVNSVVAIVLYSVCKEFAWGGNVDAAQMAYIFGYKLIFQIFGVGLIFGWIFGYLASYVWPLCNTKEERFVLLFSSCMMLLFGWKKIGLGGGGTLAALAFGASIQYYITSNDYETTVETENFMAQMWKKLGSVLLFTLLGASLDFNDLAPLGAEIGLAAVVIVVGLIGRSIVTFLSVLPIKSWTVGEKKFAIVTWCPKATVQAALASDALDTLKGLGQNHPIRLITTEYVYYERMGMIILVTSILSIIMTAPTFAVAMQRGGVAWLTREKKGKGGN